MSRRFSFYLLLAIILLAGIVLYNVMAGFLIPLFLAAVLVVVFRPIHRWISHRCRDRERVAAALTTLAIMLIVIAPLAWIFTLAVTEGVNLATGATLDDLKKQLAEIRGRIEEKYNLRMADADLMHSVEFPLSRLTEEFEERREFADHEDLINTLKDAIDRLQTEPANLSSNVGKTEEDALRAVLATSKRNLQQAMSDLMDNPSSTGSLYPDNLLDVQVAYQKYRHQLLGGSFKAWLIDALNPSDEQFRRLRNWMFTESKRLLFSITGTGAALVSSMVFNLAIMVIAVYYFLADGPGMIRAGMHLSPLEDRYEEEILSEFDTSCRAVVLATLLTAIAQGLLAGIGYYFAGLHSVFLLTMLTMVLALVPFIGAAAIWFPACLWLFLQGHTVAAGFLFIYGALIVSMADNVIKPYVLHGQSKLHPLLALMSVIGGVQALGPIGILVGPMLVTFLQALLNMLQSELSSIGEETAAS